MSVPITLNYNDSADYDFPDTIDITGGKAQLKLLEDNVDFTEDFSDDTGFTYDSSKSEFIGGLNRQKDQTGDALFGVNFTIDQNANFSTGSGTGTLNGGATVNNGKLDLSGGILAYALYNPTNNLGINQGTIRFKLTPKYSGAPPSYQYIISTEALVGIAGEITLFHTISRNLAITIRDNVGDLIFSSIAFGYWGQVADQEYEFELNFNFDVGGSEIRLFVDGVQLGSTLTTGMTSTARGRFYVGCEWSASTNIDILVDDILLFDTVQHTANYTPGYIVSSYIYAETSVVLPEMEHTGDGSILAFNLLSLTYSGSPRILLEIGRSGDKLYWDGSSLAVSDGSYDQAVDLATFNLHVDAFEVEGEKYGQFTIVYPDSNTISAVSELTANMLVNIGYSTANPLIKPNLTTKIDGLEDWEEIVEKTGSDDVKAICELNGIDKYYNGSAWAESSGYSQSNSIAEILANKATLLIEGYGKNFRIGRYLHSADGSTTPKLDTDTLSVNFSGISPTIKEIFIYGNLRDIYEGLDDITIYYRWPWSHGNKVITTNDFQEYETFPEGYFEISIKHEDSYPPPYFEFKIKNKLFKYEYPSDELLAGGDYIEVGNLTVLSIKTVREE